MIIFGERRTWGWAISCAYVRAVCVCERGGERERVCVRARALSLYVRVCEKCVYMGRDEVLLEVGLWEKDLM